MDGNFRRKRNAAAKTRSECRARREERCPISKAFCQRPSSCSIAFERWNDLVKLPGARSVHNDHAVWHSLRGVAFANLGKTAEAEKEQAAFRDVAAKIPEDTMYDPLNKAGAVFKVHDIFSRPNRAEPTRFEIGD